MEFDEKISNTVSLSQILDCFLVEDEKPSTIFSFLGLYEKKIVDILKYSCATPRMFALDFLKKCSRQELIELSKIIELKLAYSSAGRPLDEVDCLVWQIFCCKDVPESTKSIFRTSLEKLRGLRPEHPYGGFGGKKFETIDAEMLSIENGPFELSYAINKLTVDELKTFTSSVVTMKNRSLFIHRVLQTDVWQLIDPMRQFLILNNLPWNKWWISTHKSLKQILSHDFHSDMKRLVCDKIKSRDSELGWVKYIGKEEINECKTLNEFLMKGQIRGDWGLVDWSWVVYKILVIKGLDFFHGCGKYGGNFLRKHLDITELVACP